MSKGFSYYVPQSFQPADIVPLGLLRHCQGAYVIMGQIMRGMAYAKKTMHGHRYATLNQKYIEADLGRDVGQRLLRALIDSGEIRQLVHPKSRRAFGGYLPAEKYVGAKLRKVPITDERLLRRLERTEARKKEEHKQQQQERWRPADDFWYQWQFSLGIDGDQATEIIGRMDPRSNPYDVQSILVDNIANRRFRYVIDPFGRVHNAISSMHSSLRAALRIGRRELWQVDIKNSQPCFLGLVLMHSLPLQRGKQFAYPMVCGGPSPVAPPAPRQYPVVPPLAGVLPVSSEDGQNVPFSGSRGFSFSGDVHLFLESVSEGSLYEQLMSDTGLDRRTVKKRFLTDVLGKRGNYPSDVEFAFSRRYPSVYGFVRDANHDDHGTLLRQLQRSESDFLIVRVGERLARTRGRYLSLHDAVFSRDPQIVEEAIMREAAAMGYSLRVTVEAA